MSKWTVDWPTEPGRYWFFGWLFKARATRPDMYLGRVACTDSGDWFAIVEGDLIIQGREGRDGHFGVWMKAELPEEPHDHLSLFGLEYLVRHGDEDDEGEGYHDAVCRGYD